MNTFEDLLSDDDRKALEELRTISDEPESADEEDDDTDGRQ